MRRKSLILGMLTVVMALSSCATHYTTTNVSRVRLLVDQQYDQNVDPAVTQFMQPYKEEVDKLISPVLGQAAMPLESYKPESPLSNLLPDVLVWAGQFYNEKPDFGLYNIGGIRASIAQGNITIGDIYDVAPFENKICFLTLTGQKTLELMNQIVARGGEGISKEVHIVATKDGKLKKATINGKEIDPNAQYRVSTIDYLSHGNDGLNALKDGTDRREMTEKSDLTRELIMKYVRECQSKGKAIESKIEGRIIVEE